MTASPSTASVPIEVAFRRGPAKVRADYAKAGFLPADRFQGKFPAEALLGIAVIDAHCLLPTDPHRVVTIRLCADDLTDEEDVGARLVLSGEASHGCTAVSRQEALRAIEDWQAKARDTLE